MKAMLVPLGQIDRPPRGDDRGRVIANPRCDRRRRSCPRSRSRCARTVASSSQWAQIGSVVSAKMRFERRLLVDEQIARAGADEDLDPRRARRLVSARPRCAASRRCRSRNSPGTCRRPGRASLRAAACVIVAGIGVGHLQKCRDAAFRAGPRGACADPPCASAPARGSGPGRRSRRAADAGRGRRRLRPPRYESPDRSRQSGSPSISTLVTRQPVGKTTVASRISVFTGGSFLRKSLDFMARLPPPPLALTVLNV